MRRRPHSFLEHHVIGWGFDGALVVGGETPEFELGLYVLVDDGEAGELRCASGFVEDGIDVIENLIDGHGVHLAAVVVAGLDGRLEVASSGLSGEVVGDDLAVAALLLDPRSIGHGDPDRAAIDGEADIGGIGMAGSDGDDGSLPHDTEGLLGPAVRYFEVFIHGFSLVQRWGWGKATARIRR